MENLINFIISFVSMAVFFFVMAFIFLFMLRKNQKWFIIIAVGFIYNAAITLLPLMLASNADRQVIINNTNEEIQKNSDNMIKEAQKNGATAADIARIKGHVDALLIRPFVAWSIISTLFLVYLVYSVVRLYALNKYGLADGMPPFELWRGGEPVMWAFIACVLPLLWKWNGNKLLLDVLYNGVFVFVAFYFTIGMSVISYLMIKYQVSSMIKFIFYLGLVLWSFLGIIMVMQGNYEWAIFGLVIILTGILDTWFNFRKLEKGA